MAPLSNTPAPFAPAVALATALLAATCALPAPAAAGPGDAAGPGATPPGDSALVGRALRHGLENVALAPGGLAFENRRYRHVADAIGRLAGAGAPVVLHVGRLGLPAAAVHLDAGGEPAAVRYPFERGESVPGAGPRLRPTHRSLDVIVGPLVSFELGRIYDAGEIAFDLQTQLVANPWPGGRLRASWIAPISNEFSPGPLNPDIGRPRPGPVTAEQYAWVQGVGLASGTIGLLGDNRWGLSLGVARPIAQGIVLLDAQLDRTGFFAWLEDGANYSSPDLWTGFAGITVRPPRLDLALRARAARYLYGDDGVDVEMVRAMGDVDLGFFSSWSDGVRVTGARLSIPVPPLTRPTGQAIRVLPVESFGVEYRDEATPYGVSLAEVASRERFLQHLALPTLAANSGRIRAAREGRPGREAVPASDLDVSFVGSTGFVTTPHWRVLPDRQVELGYGRLAAGGAWDNRGRAPNEVWSATFGYLPRTEVLLRWTVMPGVKAFEELVPDSRLTDADRMVSARFALVEPSGWRPGLAVGVDDASGTRRFHSTYVVAGTSGRIRALRVGVGGGYAPSAFEATRHVLDGGFGAVEVALPPHARIVVEHDSERWNAGFGLTLLGHLKLRAGWMDFRHPAVGIGWSMHLGMVTS